MSRQGDQQQQRIANDKKNAEEQRKVSEEKAEFKRRNGEDLMTRMQRQLKSAAAEKERTEKSLQVYEYRQQIASSKTSDEKKRIAAAKLEDFARRKKEEEVALRKAEADQLFAAKVKNEKSDRNEFDKKHEIAETIRKIQKRNDDMVEKNQKDFEEKRGILMEITKQEQFLKETKEAILKKMSS